MSSSATDRAPRAVGVECSCEDLTVVLADGRRLSVPLSWFPRLQDAPPESRVKFELLGGGVGIHWPGLDEDLSIEGLLRGVRASEKRSTVD